MASCHGIQIKKLYFHRCKYQRRPGWGPGGGIRRGLRSPWASCTGVFLWQQRSCDPGLNKTSSNRKVIHSQDVRWPWYPVCKSALTQNHKGYWVKSSFIGAENAEVCQMKNGQIDWITYIFRRLSSDQAWVCLHLDILPPPEALSALPSNIHLFPPPDRSLLKTDEASPPKDKIVHFHFSATYSRCVAYLWKLQVIYRLM